MAAEESRTVQHDEPAATHAETREEKIARVVDAEEAAGARYGGSADPSTRRGMHRTLSGSLLGFAAAGAVIGAVLGIILSLAPGPFETDGVGAAIGYVVVLAIAFAIVVGLLGALLTLAREDGRVEREVEHSTGRGPTRPGSPQAPEHDLKKR
jgi:hypothetical protein